MSDRPYRLGFIGGALNSAVGYTHFVASTMDRRWEVVAGCFSQNRAQAVETAAAYGVPSARSHGSVATFLEREAAHVDAVAVLTPTPSHARIVADCMEAGVPVICEKALAVSADEVRWLRSLEQRHRAFLAVTYNYTGYPMLRELKARIGSGELGRILHFQLEMPQEGFIRTDSDGNRPTPQPWRLQDATVPTIYLDLAVHLHQIVHYLIGERPVEVVSDQSGNGWFDGIVDNVACLARYSGGVQGQFWFSKSALGHRNGLKVRIFGSKAAAEWEQMRPELLSLAHRDGRREIIDRGVSQGVAALRRYNRFKPGHPDGFMEAFANLYADIADCLSQYRATGLWFSQEVFGSRLSLEGLRWMEAMAESARSGRWEVIEENIEKETVNREVCRECVE